MTGMPVGLRRAPKTPIGRLFGPVLALPEGAVWPVGWFRCVACPEIAAASPAPAADDRPEPDADLVRGASA